MISRRGILLGLIAAPIVVRPGILMPVKPLTLVDLAPDVEWEAAQQFKGGILFTTYSYKLKYDQLKRTIYDEVTESSWKDVKYVPDYSDPAIMVITPVGEPTVTVSRQYRHEQKPLEGPTAEVQERGGNVRLLFTGDAEIVARVR